MKHIEKNYDFRKELMQLFSPQSGTELQALPLQVLKRTQST